MGTSTNANPILSAARKVNPNPHPLCDSLVTLKKGREAAGNGEGGPAAGGGPISLGLLVLVRLAINAGLEVQTKASAVFPRQSWQVAPLPAALKAGRHDDSEADRSHGLRPSYRSTETVSAVLGRTGVQPCTECNGEGIGCFPIFSCRDLQGHVRYFVAECLLVIEYEVGK